MNDEKPPELLCPSCRHARRTRISTGELLPLGRFRCAHPVTRMPVALVSTENPEKHPAARHLIELEGPWSQKAYRDVFRWPWEFHPVWVQSCKGYEK